MSALFPEAECFRTILADPPWLYDQFGQQDHGGARAVYDCLPDEAIAALPVKRIAADNSVCVLWVTRPVVTEGRHVPVLEAWGFRPVTTAFVWLKRYTNGNENYCGLGSYTRSGTEVAVLGIRGSCPRAEDASNVLEVVRAPVIEREIGEDGEREKHSSKPDVHRRIERLWPTARPRVELFARRRRRGWNAWGAQAPSCDLVFGPEVGRVFRWAPVRVELAEVVKEGRLFA